MGKRSGGRLVIKYVTQASWGLAPLPKTSYELTTDGSADWVKITHTAGENKKSLNIEVPSGTYTHWIDKLEDVWDRKSLNESLNFFMDGNSQDISFIVRGEKVNLHWMGGPPEDQQVVNDLTNWLNRLRVQHWNEE